MKQPNVGDLRVWWIPEIPLSGIDPFYVYVRDVKEAIYVLELLANYDIYHFENDLKGEWVSNAGGLEIYESDGEWVEWYDEDTGMDIDEYMEEL